MLLLKAKKLVREFPPCRRIGTCSTAGNFKKEHLKNTLQCNSKYVYQLSKCCDVESFHGKPEETFAGM